MYAEQAGLEAAGPPAFTWLFSPILSVTVTPSRASLGAWRTGGLCLPASPVSVCVSRFLPPPLSSLLFHVAASSAPRFPASVYSEGLFLPAPTRGEGGLVGIGECPCPIQATGEGGVPAHLQLAPSMPTLPPIFFPEGWRKGRWTA